MIKLISFDFDGTICPDSGNIKLYENELSKILKKKYSLTELTRENKKKIKKNMSQKKWEELKTQASHYWIENAEIPKNIRNSLITLNKKFKLIIFSSASKKHINKILDKSKVDKSIFKDIYSTREDFGNKKTKESWMYKEIAKKERLNPNECMHIGDNLEQDYKNSRKANFRSFLIEHEKIDRISFKELLEMD